jgi:DedD protein
VAQVGVFGTRANADRLVTQLKAKGFAAYAEPTTGTSNRVVVGPFSDRAEADQAAARLRAEGFQPLVRR